MQLKARRLTAGLTQTELARRMATSQGMVARVEGAKVRPGLEFIDRWARATGIPLPLLLGGREPAISPEQRRQRVVEAFGEDVFDPWKRNPSLVEQRTLRGLGIEPGADAVVNP